MQKSRENVWIYAINCIILHRQLNKYTKHEDKKQPIGGAQNDYFQP